MGIASLFSAPFFEGAQIADDTPYYLPVSIGSHSYLIDLRKYKRQTIAPIRPPQDNSAEPGEQSLNQEGLWRRSQSSFHLGAGQEYFDEADSVRQRSWKSKGVDVWTRKKLKLLKDTEIKLASAGTNLKVLQVGTRLYIADGNNVKFHNTPDTAGALTFTDSTMAIGSQAVGSITTDGARVWATFNTSGIRESVSGSTSAITLIAGTFSLVGYANQRLLAANANVLYEISRAGVATTIWTHPNPDFVWKSITDLPSGVLFGGTCVDRTTFYSAANLDATGVLGVPVIAGSLPDGETINSVEYYGGAVMLGTSRGLRVALIGSNNSLTHGPVIEIGNVQCSEGQGEYVWFGWSNYDASSTGLGRCDLSQFTSQLVPAYASDLMATTQGAVLSVATVGSRRYFAVSGVGFFGETATLVASGIYETGRINYGTIEKKIATYLDLRHDPLPSGASIQSTVETEESNLSVLGSSAVAGAMSPASPLGINIQITEAFRIKLTLNRAAALGPELKRWTVYSRVTPILSDEIVVPLIVKDWVQTDLGDGQGIWYDPLEEYRFLKAIAAAKSIQTYQEGKASYTVYLTGVTLEPDSWNTEHAFFNGLIYVRLVTMEMS